MQHFTLTTLACILVGQCVLCKAAVLKIDYGSLNYFYHIEFMPGIFQRLISCLTGKSTRVCSLYLTPVASFIGYVANDVKELILDYETSVVPKYFCEYQSIDKSIKCERIKVLVTCQHVQTSDLFGIKWAKEGEFLSDYSIINSTHQCLGEYGSIWPITYYSWAPEHYPINYQYTKTPRSQGINTSRESYEDTMREYIFVETSTSRNQQTTETPENSSNASLTVIVTCSVLGVIILIIFGVVIYFLICKKKLRKKRNDRPTVNVSTSRYEEVRFLPDNNRLANLQTSNNNFSGISNIYSYPFPYSVNKKQDKKQDIHLSNVNENSLSDYSNPVDSYGDPNEIRNGVLMSYTGPEATSSYSANGLKINSSEERKTADYSTPEDSYDVPKSGVVKANGDYAELESVTYSNKDYQVTNFETPHDYSNPGDCVLKRISKEKVHEYNKLGEENKKLLHEYDHLEMKSDPVDKPPIYSLSKNFDSV